MVRDAAFPVGGHFLSSGGDAIVVYVAKHVRLRRDGSLSATNASGSSRRILAFAMNFRDLQMKRLLLALLTCAALAGSSPVHAAVKTIVLVHGAFADGSGWKPVADILQSHGFAVRVVQKPETSFAADVAPTRRVLDKAGPCVLVGHSYGGRIITETRMHPDVKGLAKPATCDPPLAARTPKSSGSSAATAAACTLWSLPRKETSRTVGRWRSSANCGFAP